MNDPVLRRSYLQFHVPLDMRAQWYEDLKEALDGVEGARWQNGHFHVTAAFINDEIGPEEAGKVSGALDDVLRNVTAPVIRFDSIKAFTTRGGGEHVVYLAASDVPEELETLVGKVRERLEESGYRLGPFRLHVTLARIPSGSIGLEALRRRLQGVGAPDLTRALKKADYRFYREFRRTVREWSFRD